LFFSKAVELRIEKKGVHAFSLTTSKGVGDKKRKKKNRKRKEEREDLAAKIFRFSSPQITKKKGRLAIFTHVGAGRGRFF